MEAPVLSTEEETRMKSSYHEIYGGGGGGGGGGVGEGEEGEGDEGGRAQRFLSKARHWVGDLGLEGVVSHQGHQLTYVKEDVGARILESRPTPTYPPDSLAVGEVGDGDGEPCHLNLVINEMEMEAKRLASSIDTLTENLTGILHSLSSMTVDCVFAGSDGVSQLCDTADASIKVMYQVMAKSEELNKAVFPIYQVHQQIKDTKRLLDKVEAEIN